MSKDKKTLIENSVWKKESHAQNINKSRDLYKRITHY